jgi:outer membrane protein TolC
MITSKRVGLKRIGIIAALSMCLSQNLFAQQAERVNIDSCYLWAQKNYPLVKQFALIGKSKEFSIDNANKGLLPQFSIAGQATHQSDVTQVPVSIPNMDIPTLSKDQYKIYGEVSQSITDIFTIKDQKAIVKNNAVVEEQKIEIELYKIKERINQLYFGILLIDAQILQNEIVKKDIQSGSDKALTAINNGTALKSTEDVLKAEMLKANQREIELKSIRKGYGEMLSLFINRSIDENTVLEKPVQQQLSSSISRPEMRLFETQRTSMDLQAKMITNKTLPKLSLFFQGGYGRPALNMLSNEFDTYYVGGLRLNWNISSFYTSKKEKAILSLNQSSIDIQRQVFLFNSNVTLKQQNSEISKLQEFIRTDIEIIALRERVKNATKTQLEFGTATTTDYINQVNAEDQSRQNQLIHEIQLLLAQYNHQITTGN